MGLLAWILGGVVFITPPPPPAVKDVNCPPPPEEEATAAIQVTGPHAIVLGREAKLTLMSFNGGSWAEYKIDWEGSGQYEHAYTGPNEPTELTHAFPSQGTYVVTIRVRLDDGAFGVARRNVTVETLPADTSTITQR